MLKASEVYRLIGPVDIQPVLDDWDRLSFFLANPGGDRNDPKKMPCWVILQATFSPPLKAVLASASAMLGGEVARAVVRKLDAYQGIPPHVDAWMPKETNWRRFQLPLVSHPDIKMRWPEDDVEAHLAPGNLYEVRFDRTHEVVNPTDAARTHLQIDQLNATI